MANVTAIKQLAAQSPVMTAATLEAANANLLVWHDPDMSLVKSDEIDPPAFDYDSLPPAWGQWCKTTAAAKACPVDFVALNLLVYSSAWLGNARRVKVTDDWIEPPHLWGAIIAPPSGGKTPSQQPFDDVCSELELEEEPAWTDKVRDWKRDNAAAVATLAAWEGDIKQAIKNNTPPPDMPMGAEIPAAPQKPRVIVKEATTQEAINLLAANPKGLLVARDELSGWLGTFDRYSGSGADRAFYLEAWNGGRYSVDLVKLAGKPVSVPYASLAITGGLQPDKLREALSGSDDGLASRLLYVYPKLTPYAPLMRGNDAACGERKRILADAARRLRALAMTTSDKGNPIAKAIPLSDAALALFEINRRESIDSARHSRGLLAGWHGKNAGRALRLALGIEFLSWAILPDGTPEPIEVSGDAMACAAAYLDYSTAMFERVINGLAMDVAESDAADVMEYIAPLVLSHHAGNEPQVINERKLYQSKGYRHLRNSDRRRNAFKVLERYGWVQQVPTVSTGRQKGDWITNPQLKTLLVQKVEA